MKLLFWRIKHFFLFLSKSKSKYGIHSPFVYEFITKVLPAKKTVEGQKIDELRRNLFISKEILQIEDFGAGYQGVANSKIEKTVSQVVKSSARSRNEGEFLMRLVSFYKFENLLELGTNLGFSGLYQQKGMVSNAQFTTIEGSESLANFAKQLFENQGFSPKIIVSPFLDFLKELKTNENNLYDYVLMDGHHQKEPTLNYVKLIKPYLKPNAFVLIDDINWTEEMYNCWVELIKDEDFTVSIELYQTGILIYKKNQVKEHFVLR